jgi:hypothetical protein
MDIYITDKRGKSAKVTMAGGVSNLSDSPSSFVPSVLMSSAFIGWSTPQLIYDIQLALGHDSQPDWFGEVTSDAWPPVELRPGEVAKVGRSSYTKMTGNPFGRDRGDTKYDTNSLFLYDGPRNPQGTNVMIVLWRFPAYPSRKKLNSPFQEGRLLTPRGLLFGGDIEWEIAEL